MLELGSKEGAFQQPLLQILCNGTRFHQVYKETSVPADVNGRVHPLFCNSAESIATVPPELVTNKQVNPTEVKCHSKERHGKRFIGKQEPTARRPAANGSGYRILNRTSAQLRTSHSGKSIFL